ncbi:MULTISPECIES: hypothetical protein [unclassified Streptomyces]|uniref:hypothetical protein n=1 Tax=unclassified Streptomyces TaxID=2593676 RepID=UPI002E808ACB|nr:hypothetical protein [Streptomyces sp. NBC_00589]WTI41888.1 hypothetical protein OIC96_46355 [Streptomyces sp. NBC_00775]WUB24429.1 hypothetical protein OHA51_03365 [Streptomyces sp. NBC_00589]
MCIVSDTAPPPRPYRGHLGGVGGTHVIGAAVQHLWNPATASKTFPVIRSGPATHQTTLSRPRLAGFHS